MSKIESDEICLVNELDAWAHTQGFPHELVHLIGCFATEFEVVVAIREA